MTKRIVTLSEYNPKWENEFKYEKNELLMLSVIKF
ncbi:GrpB-like predicted nucleotidyltransferase (UPF0157 family) [Kurthia huakuii]|nr:GrpB-like predicted nucleotidyltransferase (UPF0157 family) [Kurthia huakuii]